MFLFLAFLLDFRDLTLSRFGLRASTLTSSVVRVWPVSSPSSYTEFTPLIVGKLKCFRHFSLIMCRLSGDSYDLRVSLAVSSGLLVVRIFLLLLLGYNHFGFFIIILLFTGLVL